MSCTETPRAVPKTVPCLAQVEGAGVPLGSGGKSVPPDASDETFPLCGHRQRRTHKKNIISQAPRQNHLVNPGKRGGQSL